MSVIDNIKQIPNHPGSVFTNRVNKRWWIGIHTMEGGEGVNTAEDTAKWLGKGRPGLPPGPAGVHFCIDQNSIVQMARTTWVTAGAAGHLPDGTSANNVTVHIELAGKANQTPEQWADKASVATLENCAELCAKVLVPSMFSNHPSKNPPSFFVRHLNAQQMRGHNWGFVGHVDITNVCNVHGGHTDPGKYFPWLKFLQMVKDRM